MFSRFICLQYVKEGHCDKGAECKLKHVSDIGSLDVKVYERPVTAAAIPNRATKEEEKKVILADVSDDKDGYSVGSKRVEKVMAYK